MRKQHYNLKKKSFIKCLKCDKLFPGNTYRRLCKNCKEMNGAIEDRYLWFTTKGFHRNPGRVIEAEVHVIFPGEVVP